MVNPVAEPIVWIIEIFKIFVQILIGGLLFFRWYRTERHFYTDMPFLFAFSLFFAAIGESVEVGFDTGILPITLDFFKIRATIVTMSFVFYFLATMLIWLDEHRRTSHVLTLTYTILFLITIWVAPSIELVRLWAMPFLLIVFVLFIITFLWVWWMKRLPEVHGLILTIGVLIAMVGQFSKTPLDAIGLLWLSEIIDLIGLIVFAAGFFIKPRYARIKPSPSTRPID